MAKGPAARKATPEAQSLTRRLLKPLQALICLSVSFAASAEDTPPEWVIEARQGAQALGGQLKQALTQAIEEDGLGAAVAVCQIDAPGIADRVSTGNLTVGRTALRVRNPDNAADAWEQRVLEGFERRIAAGDDPASLELFAIRRHGGERQGHWMKAIPTGGLCLACHGNDIDAELKATIDQRYPLDQATGFEPGSLRGAFSVTVDLPESD
jgi:hypothetical protein